MSGVPSRPPPTPKGGPGAPKVGSFVPKAPLMGEPMSSPWEPLAPIALQPTPCVSPANEQGSGMILEMEVPSPGKVSKAWEMLPVGPRPRNCGVSDQVLLVEDELLRKVS